MAVYPMVQHLNINYTFRNQSLLQSALTHSSVSEERPCIFERLEFLGDRVLNLTIAEDLYHRFSNDHEGILAMRLNSLVCKEMLADIASTIGIVEIVQSEEHFIGQEENISSSVLCDFMEALIGAIFLDGGMDEARIFIIHHWSDHLSKMPQKDFKTVLQELCQKKTHALPLYIIKAIEGQPHKPTIYVECSAIGISASASGDSKREAEQNAAKKILSILQVKY